MQANEIAQNFRKSSQRSHRSADIEKGTMQQDLCKRLGTILRSDHDVMAMLQAVRRLDVPDCWITAGVIRNRVWDHLHGFQKPTPLNDIDVIYFDPDRRDKALEKQLDRELEHYLPGLPWSVKNQARMAERNGDPPYRSIDDALLHWCETPTAVAARLNEQAEVEITAPLGLDDLFSLIVRPTPFAQAHPSKLARYRERMNKKRWPRQWPKIRVLGL